MPATTWLRWVTSAVTALGFFASSHDACALDSSLDVSKYGHTLWRSLDGSGPQTIGPMAQTVDGYLWLGTPSGILRFDGLRSVPWRAPPGDALPDERIRALLGSRDGALWIGTLLGVGRWMDGKLVTPRSVVGKTVNVLAEGRDGTMWVGGSSGRKGFLCAIQQGSGECDGSNIELPAAILALCHDSAGALWVADKDRLWKWNSRPMESYPLPSPMGALGTMAATRDGGIVIATKDRLIRFSHGKMRSIQLPAWAEGLAFTKVMLDRDDALWIAAADFGLLHLRGDRVDAFTSSEGLSGDHVLGLFEDREGNVWASTSRGLDRFRPTAAAVYSSGDGIKGRPASVMSTRDGTLWISTSTMVYRLDDGRISAVRPSRSASMFEDHRGRVWLASSTEFGHLQAGHLVTEPNVPRGVVDGIAEDSHGTLWIAHRDAGLLHLLADGRVERTRWADLANGIRVSTMAIDLADDSLWLGLWSGTVMHVQNGKARTFLQQPDVGGTSGVNQIRLDGDGSAWIGNKVGLTHIKDGRATSFGRRNGLPCDGVHWTLEDADLFWMYTPCGLVQVKRSAMAAWSASADRNVNAQVETRLLNHTDGVVQPANVSAVGQIEPVQLFTPKVARTGDGRIWTVTADGLIAVNPARLPRNVMVPPVHVEQISSDGREYEARNGLHLGPLPRNLQITYTGLSLTAPEQMQFRYRLEGRDVAWQEAGNRRQAFYTDLQPGRYRFDVIAANNSGVWNDKGDTLEFSIAPAWWQTNLFRSSCLLVVGIALFAVYRLRIGHLERQFKLSHGVRVNERLRIARELHDTLLQSFQGLLLRLQTALELWPQADGRRILAAGIDQAAEAITEGRDAVQGLRTAATEQLDLAEALRTLRETFPVDENAPEIMFRVEVEGHVRALHPLVRDDTFRIAGEAIRNAFRHARPTRVEVELRYDERELRVRVRDDGTGMDADVSRRGLDGHFGLRGMRERAQLIGAELAFWSRPGSGTEVELKVPGSLAYAPVDGVPAELGEASSIAHDLPVAHT